SCVVKFFSMPCTKTDIEFKYRNEMGIFSILTKLILLYRYTQNICWNYASGVCNYAYRPNAYFFQAQTSSCTGEVVKGDNFIIEGTSDPQLGSLYKKYAEKAFDDKVYFMIGEKCQA